jgi:hypothetical protein
VAALGRLFIRGDWNAVAALIGDGPNPASRTAACVVTACMLMDAERHAEAVTLLSEQPDDASPVDWAWMMTQRARARAEFGDVASARQDAAAALRALVGDQDDVTASAIEASAAELLFQTAPWGEQPLDELITAIDTAVSWWRMQPLSTALREAADRTFRQWADEQATRIEFDDTVNDQLYAAVLSADMTGAQGAFQANGSLLARNTLMAGHAQRDTNRQADGLDALRRSGDEKSLDLAARRLWEVGPLGPLAEAARRIQPSSWTHTAAGDAVHRDLAGVLTSLPPVTDQLRALGWAQVAARLRATVLAATSGPRWLAAGCRGPALPRAGCGDPGAARRP